MHELTRQRVSGKHWTPSGNPIASASHAVFATAHGVTMQTALAWLPLTSIRGQTTHLPPPITERSSGCALRQRLPATRSIGAALHGRQFRPGRPGYR